jgi:hypothetical protein
MMQDNQVERLGAMIRDTDGKWIVSPEAKAEALAMYYSGRLAYSREDRRVPIGRYTPTGEVIPFSRHHVSNENGA